KEESSYLQTAWIRKRGLRGRRGDDCWQGRGGKRSNARNRENGWCGWWRECGREERHWRKRPRRRYLRWCLRYGKRVCDFVPEPGVRPSARSRVRIRRRGQARYQAWQVARVQRDGGS